MEPFYTKIICAKYTEIALFSDNGIFYNHTDSFIVSDIGIGIRFNLLIFNKPIYLRFDFPTYLKNDFGSKNGEFFVFSFVNFKFLNHLFIFKTKGSNFSFNFIFK